MERTVSQPGESTFTHGTVTPSGVDVMLIISGDYTMNNRAKDRTYEIHF